MTATAPVRTYTSLDAAYDHFNAELFGGALPACLITMQRHKGSYGYFSGDRFASTSNPQEITDEIALNPSHFAERTPSDTLSVLAHEMAHLWQHHFGKPGRGGYHNKEWAAKMREIGLIPTDTGLPDGKQTGDRMSHYIEEGGRFAVSCAAFLATGPAILYGDRTGHFIGKEPKEPGEREKKNASKTKYTCPACGVNAWAKPKTNLVCGDCGQQMEAESRKEEGNLNSYNPDARGSTGDPREPAHRG